MLIFCWTLLRVEMDVVDSLLMYALKSYPVRSFMNHLCSLTCTLNIEIYRNMLQSFRNLLKQY